MYVPASSIINFRTYIFIEFIIANIYVGKQEICMLLLLLILIDVSDNKGKSRISYIEFNVELCLFCNIVISLVLLGLGT